VREITLVTTLREIQVKYFDFSSSKSINLERLMRVNMTTMHSSNNPYIQLTYRRPTGFYCHFNNTYHAATIEPRIPFSVKLSLLALLL